MWVCKPTEVFGGKSHASEWSIFNSRGDRVARVQAANTSAAANAKLIVEAVNNVLAARDAEDQKMFG